MFVSKVLRAKRVVLDDKVARYVFGAIRENCRRETLVFPSILTTIYILIFYLSLNNLNIRRKNNKSICSIFHVVEKRIKC